MSRSFNVRVEPHLGRRPATLQDDPTAIEAGDHRYLIGIIACSSGGDVTGRVEDSADNSTFATVAASSAVIDAQTDSEHQIHAWVIDRQKVRKYARINYTIDAGTPATCVVHLKLRDPLPDDDVTELVAGSVGQPGGVTYVGV